MKERRAEGEPIHWRGLDESGRPRTDLLGAMSRHDGSFKLFERADDEAVETRWRQDGRWSPQGSRPHPPAPSPSNGEGESTCIKRPVHTTRQAMNDGHQAGDERWPPGRRWTMATRQVMDDGHQAGDGRCVGEHVAVSDPLQRLVLSLSRLTTSPHPWTPSRSCTTNRSCKA